MSVPKHDGKKSTEEKRKYKGRKKGKGRSDGKKGRANKQGNEETEGMEEKEGEKEEEGQDRHASRKGPSTYFSEQFARIGHVLSGHNSNSLQILPGIQWHWVTYSENFTQTIHVKVT